MAIRIHLILSETITLPQAIFVLLLNATMPSSWCCLLYCRFVYSHFVNSHVVYSHLVYSHLVYSHLVYSHLVYSHLVYSHLVYSHLVYSHLVYSHLVYSHLVYNHLVCLLHNKMTPTTPINDHRKNVFGRNTSWWNDCRCDTMLPIRLLD